MNLADIILGGLMGLGGLWMMLSTLLPRRFQSGAGWLGVIGGLPFFLGGFIRCASGFHFRWATYELASHAMILGTIPLMIWIIFSIVFGPEKYPLVLRLFFAVMGVDMCIYGIFNLAGAWHLPWASKDLFETVFRWTAVPATVLLIGWSFWVTSSSKKQSRKSHGT